MKRVLEGKRILLGVTGSIACYKAADLASKLTQAGASLDAILTQAATQFVTPLTFQSVTGRRAYVDADLWGDADHVLHVGLVEDADSLVVAPATANTLAKLAHGQADNLLTLTALAANCPLLVAPAMDAGMYSHPATQANLETLRQRGVTLVGPVSGHLASGLEARGRMVEPQELLGHVRLLLGKDGPLAGRKVIVTAGGTREAMDPVRFIANHSSGKQGFALAQAALDLGASVTLLSGPSYLDTPVGAERVDVHAAEEMRDAVLDVVEKADVLIMAAAVADFRPAKAAKGKIKKNGEPPQFKLENTPDILSEVAKHRKKSGKPKVVVGFAAEDRDLLANAEKKLKSKGLDLIAANDISGDRSGFEADVNQVTLLFPGGEKEDLPRMDKFEVAQEILERAQRMLEASN